MLRSDSKWLLSLYPVLLLLISMTSIQSSASLAKSLFPVLGPEGVTALRLLFSALILLVVMRPWKALARGNAWKTLIGYGVALGVMNLSIYLAMQRIPIGIAVAIEFTGPLAVAMFASRRLIDFVWIILAVIGLYLLLPIGHAAGGVDPLGAVFALLAGLCWALYIVFGKKAGATYGAATVALGSTVAALVIFPVGVFQAGSRLLDPTLLPVVLTVAILSSAIPYALEMQALTRLPSQTFGTLMSLSPALGALSGFVFLNETLTLAQWFALLCIVIASIGATLTIKQAAAPVETVAAP
ncbi:inner membrane transporter RhtA [Pseudomonas duriflava]|uniref:Inner membrane transporter RhtA n=1 Tax=Pseudomonas duriflava TaxID=459528 RepID=A0A562QC22_9PSED|nr:threonine/homoserine exporter RhtA [Pseudomonas duriflava]TWI54307.1 inner membrane transporter RhtA [Pseudomonas duriflava]